MHKLRILREKIIFLPDAAVFLWSEAGVLGWKKDTADCNTLVHMVCTTSALIYNFSFTNGVHPMCTSSALCVTLGSASTVRRTSLYPVLVSL